MKDQVPFKKILLQCLLILGCILLLNQLSGMAADTIARCFFVPVQKVRCFIFRPAPFSIGDLFYAALFLYLLYRVRVFILRWKQRTQPQHIYSLLLGLRGVFIFYLVLLAVWGVHYERPKLSRQLGLATDSVSTEELILFDSFLVNRLNGLQYQYTGLPLQEINNIAAGVYEGQKTPMAVWAKPTLLGSGLAYFGIEGYFNPFTGEAQVDHNNPKFMQPFVVAHEMAHQTGIAAEDDANLLAYIRCMESGHPAFEYSACLNIWLYTHRRVRGLDSSRANELKSRLNNTTLRQLDTLRQRRIEYQTVLDDASTFFFDLYLRMGKQKDGIGSYRNVAYSAYCWEKKKRTLPDGSIRFF